MFFTFTPCHLGVILDLVNAQALKTQNSAMTKQDLKMSDMVNPYNH